MRAIKVCQPTGKDSPTDWRTTLGQQAITNGMITLSEAPGFGIEIDPAIFSMSSSLHL